MLIDSELTVDNLSPSHTVGLELHMRKWNKYADEVSIPHSGLRTYDCTDFAVYEDKEVSIPHSGLRTPTYHLNQNKVNQ